MRPPATGLRLEPFVATRYADLNADHLLAVTSPAYDLIPPEQRRSLEGADAKNIVRLILPQEPPDGQDKYECAAEAITRWRADGTLVSQSEPALYVYRMTEPHGGAATTGVLGQIPVLDNGDGGVLPHEDVWEPVVVDRATLAVATAANLEPIVLAADVAVTDWPDVTAVVRSDADVDFTGADGVRHQVWSITDPAAIERISSTVRGGVAVIADGHHRWASYQRILRSPHHRGASHALVYLVPVTGAGLRVRAIHRVLHDYSIAELAEIAAAAYTVDDISADLGSADPETSATRALDRLAEAEPHTVIVTDGERWIELSHPDASLSAEALGDDHQHNWRQLDIALTHRLLIEHLLGIDPSTSRLQPSYDPALTLRHLSDDPASRRTLLMLVRSSSPAQVLAVARDGDRMPRKSTLFVPKPRTGLLIRQFGDNS